MELFGRDRELAALRAALASATGGAGRTVLVVGEAGIGKTGLVDAVRAEAAGMLVLAGAGWDEGGAPPYWPWVQVLRQAARHRAAGAVDGALGPLLDPAGPSADDRFALFDAVARELTGLAEARPILVVVEDLHAAGAATAALLEFLARHTRRDRVLLVATYRPAEVDGETATVVRRLEAQAVIVEPAPLGADDVGRVLAAHGVPMTEELAARVAGHTQGNPLYVTHLARHLAAGRGTDGAGLPPGLAEALRRRADAVTTGTAWPQCLAVAAVLGAEFRLPALARVLGAEPVELAPTITAAETAGVLRRDPLDPTRLAFTHALVRDALAEGLAAAERAAWHLRIAPVLEERGAPVSLVAHHYAAAWPAGGAAEAARTCRQAGDEALAALAHDEAVTAYLGALTALGRVEDSTDADRCAALLRLAVAQSGAARGAEARRTAERAAELAAAVGDPALVSRAALLVAEHAPFNAVDHGAIAALRDAVRAWAGRQHPLHAQVLARLATMTVQAERATAQDHARAAERAAGADAAALAVALSAQLHVAWGRHDPRTALATARRITAPPDDPAAAAAAAIWVLVFSLELGDLDGADAALRTLDEVAETSRRPALQHLALSRRATLDLVRGRFAEGLAGANAARALATRAELPDADAVWWGQAFTVWRRTGLPPAEAADMERVATHLTEVSPFRVAHESALVQMLVARGAVAEAHARFDRMIAGIDELHHDLLHVWSLAVLAQDCVALGRADAAPAVRQALAPFADRLVVAAGGVTCLGSAAHLLGELAVLVGDVSAARAHFAGAATAHRAAGCAVLAAESEAAGAALVGPRVEIRVDGAVVAVRHGTRVVRLPRSLGLTYLRTLVEHPGTPITALDLAGGHAEPAPPVEQDVVDRAALTAYRQRLAELDEELTESRAWHDAARLDRLEGERAFLIEELRGSLGLGGRPRRFTDEAERARVNVTRALRSAIARVAAEDAEIGHLLDRSVTTGRACRFDPAT